MRFFRAVENAARLLPVLIVCVLFLAHGKALARIPEHPAQVSIPELANNAGTIFRGSVLAVIPTHDDRLLGGAKGSIAQFAVDRWYKGTATSNVQVLFQYDHGMAVSGHDCIDFQPGTYWIVFATGDGPLRLVHDCEGALTVSSQLGSLIASTGQFTQMAADFAAGLTDLDPQARITSIQRLGNLKSRSVLPFLHHVLATGSDQERKWAVYAALRSGDISVLPEVKKVLDYEGRSLPEDLMAPELNSIRDKAAVPDLISILQSDPKAGAAVIAALGGIRDPAALPAIAAHLSDSDRFVRYQALDAVEKMTNSSACKVEAPLRDENLEVTENQCLIWWQRERSLKPKQDPP